MSAAAGAIAAIGERSRLRGFSFAGVRLVAAEDADAARAAWRELPEEVALVILTPLAHASLQGELGERADRLYAVIPS